MDRKERISLISRRIQFLNRYAPAIGRDMEWLISEIKDWLRLPKILTMENKVEMTKIQEIREREERATEGPWFAKINDLATLVNHDKLGTNDGSVSWGIVEKNDVGSMFVADYGMEGGNSETNAKNNAEFSAHAREDVPFLLAEINRLQLWNAYLGKQVNDLQKKLDDAEAFLEV